MHLRMRKRNAVASNGKITVLDHTSLRAMLRKLLIRRLRGDGRPLGRG